MILHGVRLRGVVRRSQAGGLAFSIIVTFCASLLKVDLFNSCLYSDIVASADSFVFEPSRPLACNIKLVLF